MPGWHTWGSAWVERKGRCYWPWRSALRVAVLLSGGFQNRQNLPEVGAFNFAGHVTALVLMLNGRYDIDFPVES